MARRGWIILVALLVAGVLAAPLAAQGSLPETAVQVIALSGPAAESDAEISGLAWYGDTLLLVVENPNLYASGGYAGSFFALSKADILAYLDAADPAPLEPFAIPILSADLRTNIYGFDGFEAAAFSGDRIYLSAEVYWSNGGMGSYIVDGTIAPDLSLITLDLDHGIELGPQTVYRNLSYESLLVSRDHLIAFHETYGPAVNGQPLAYVMDLDLTTAQPVAFPALPYRLTDVAAGEGDEFWGINFFFPGDTFLAEGDDPLADRYGEGASHERLPQVERLVRFAVSPDLTTFQIAEAAPIPLRLSGLISRNWEGLARLDGRGFLIVTDEFPRTVFGFVPVD